MMRLLSVPVVMALAVSTAASQEPLPTNEALIDRAKSFELDTPYVPPPGDPLEHHTSGFAKIMCSAVFITEFATPLWELRFVPARDSCAATNSTATRSPRRRGEDFCEDAHGPQSNAKNGTGGPIPIADQVARSLIPGENFCDLAAGPVQAIPRLS
jgi:hypothetical protein